MLQALLDAGIENVAFGTIYDPGDGAAGDQGRRRRGDRGRLGGHTDQSMGAPVKAKAVVKMLSDGIFKNDGPMNAGVETSMGPTAVLRIGGIDVVTISSRIQTIDLQVFLSQGIDPTAKSVLVVKSVQHFRAAYAPIAREIVLVDSGGICSPDISRLKFTKLRRPIWPLDGVNDPYRTDSARLAFREPRRASRRCLSSDRYGASVSGGICRHRRQQARVYGVDRCSVIVRRDGRAPNLPAAGDHRGLRRGRAPPGRPRQPPRLASPDDPVVPSSTQTDQLARLLGEARRLAS